MPASSDSSESGFSPQWFEEWFNHPLYLEVYRHRDYEEAARCVKTILSVTGLAEKHPHSISVLDIACGAGRHALELARHGFCVTGNDLSPFLLDEARKEALRCKLDLKFTCCDMRNIVGSGQFDLIVQLFTSFGYFESSDDDRLVLSKVCDALKSGGWYVLDLINPLHLAKNLVLESNRTAGELSILEKRAIKEGRITKTITISAPDGQMLTFSESVRLFSKSEILEMLCEAGFTETVIVGNYPGDPFMEEESPRMILICRKP